MLMHSPSWWVSGMTRICSLTALRPPGPSFASLPEGNLMEMERAGAMVSTKGWRRSAMRFLLAWQETSSPFSPILSAMVATTLLTSLEVFFWK